MGGFLTYLGETVSATGSGGNGEATGLVVFENVMEVSDGYR